jgi:L-asparaginase
MRLPCYTHPDLEAGGILCKFASIMAENANTKQGKASVLLIYTGGTIGMTENPETGALEPFNFQHLKDNMPELKKLGYSVSVHQFDPPVDSASMGPEGWQKIVEIIVGNYTAYDGFVVLHGTDTMSYTASALSFMLENLSKPVILTGSQLPIGMLRTDGKENLITAIEIAAAKENGQPVVPEVCIFFENTLFRGNRTRKINADHFNAFRSYNYPPLAQAGIHIKYDTAQIYYPLLRKPLKAHYLLDRNIAILKLFPGISPHVTGSILNAPGLKAVVMETFGSGNAPMEDWFLNQVKEAVARGLVIVNITQCAGGSVEMHRYETGKKLLEAGVVSGYDSTTESAVTKLMFLFGHGLTPGEVKEHINCSLIGEITIPDKKDNA